MNFWVWFALHQRIGLVSATQTLSVSSSFLPFFFLTTATTLVLACISFWVGHQEHLFKEMFEVVPERCERIWTWEKWGGEYRISGVMNSIIWGLDTEKHRIVFTSLAIIKGMWGHSFPFTFIPLLSLAPSPLLPCTLICLLSIYFSFPLYLSFRDHPPWSLQYNFLSVIYCLD